MTGRIRRQLRGRLMVWFHRSRCVAWLLLGAWSFPAGWSSSVVLVWIASVYANAVTDWGAGEAADDRRVLTELASLRAQVRELHDLIRHPEVNDP